MSTFVLKTQNVKYTPVSNSFIENYMTSARGDFVKVYLLMLKYTTTGEPGVNSTVLASRLNLLESDVMNALNYWNDEGVIKLVPIDRMNNFSIEFLELDDITLTDTSQVNILEVLNSKESTSLLKDIEQILARPLSNKEMTAYLSWSKDLSFPTELTLLLMEYCASRNKTTFNYIEKVAISWHEKGILTIDAAQQNIKQTEDKWIKYREILNHLGIRNNDLMKRQEDLLEKWVFTYSFPLDVIKKACDKCADRLNKADFLYIDGILTRWFKANIKTVKDVDLKDIDYKKNTKTNPKAPFKSSTNKPPSKFSNFKQREYDYDALEKELLGWDSDD